jgi:tetratricopeptide (TPR) repeat protein
MFFMRLRRGAKWAFILLIVVFAFTFLFAGVGSGGSGGDVIQELLGMRGGNPVKSAEKEVAKHPNNASDLLRLAQAYDGKQRRGDAINTYKKYLAKRPKDLSALTQLATLQQQVVDLRSTRYQMLQSELASVYGPLSSDPLQTLAGADMLINAYSGLLNTKLSNAYASYTAAAKVWEDTYKSYAKAVPMSNTLRRAQVEIALGQAASSAGDYPTAIKSYETFLRLTPKSPIAPQVKKALKELRKLSPSS